MYTVRQTLGLESLMNVVEAFSVFIDNVSHYRNLIDNVSMGDLNLSSFICSSGMTNSGI